MRGRNVGRPDDFPGDIFSSSIQRANINSLTSSRNQIRTVHGPVSALDSIHFTSVIFIRSVLNICRLELHAHFYTHLKCTHSVDIKIGKAATTAWSHVRLTLSSIITLVFVHLMLATGLVPERTARVVLCVRTKNTVALCQRVHA